MQTLTAMYKSFPPCIPWGVFTTIEDMVASKLRGFAASPGVVEGPCTIVGNPENLHTLHDGAILVCEAPSPALAPYMRYLQGLVAGRGGPHCIVAGYAREHEVPAVVGVGGVLEGLQTGDVIRIDGSRGTVEVIGDSQRQVYNT